MLKINKKQISNDGTVKFLFELEDGNLIESVLMSHNYGSSVCVTSQAGCNMGCAFCASGLLKKTRDLTAEEMLAQVRTAAAECCMDTHSDVDKKLDLKSKVVDNCGKIDRIHQNNVDNLEFSTKITHIVVMGTGEPFDNFDEVIRFCDLVSDEKKMREEPYLEAVAPRHITVSTCGLIPRISDFSKTAKRYNLAISLHAPNNEIRDQLMPVNKTYPIEDLVAAASDYAMTTRRRVTFEYILLAGVNDSLECAKELAGLLQNENFYVNLIPYNSVSEFGFKGVSKETALAFYDVLMKNGVRSTLRKERGTDISAACGQLRAEKGGNQ